MNFDCIPAVLNERMTRQQFYAAGIPKAFVKLGLRIADKVYLKTRLAEAQNWHCAWCGCAVGASTATIEHVVPKSLKGADTQDNCVCACTKCNNKRGTVPADIWLDHISGCSKASTLVKLWRNAAKNANKGVNMLEYIQGLPAEASFKMQLVKAYT